MILDGTKMIKTPYMDSRGRCGESGQLYIYENINGTKYLVKHKPLDIANEYVAHRLAMLLGVPTSDAVLILENGKFAVGIEYLDDFQRVNLDDFIGTEQYEDDDIPIFYGGTGAYIATVEVTKLKYSDDDPHLAEVMKYFAFRKIVVMDDNPQAAFSHGNLISFDYSFAFNLTKEVFDALMKDNKKMLELAVGNFKHHLNIEKGYWNSIELFRRPNTDFLFNTYFNLVMAFPDVDYNSLLDEMGQVFPKTVVDFYHSCLHLINKQIKGMIREKL